MNADAEKRRALRRLIDREQWRRIDAAAAFQVDERTIRRWITGDAPIAGPAAVLLTLYTDTPTPIQIP